MGLCGTALSWFWSYLSKRTQMVGKCKNSSPIQILLWFPSRYVFRLVLFYSDTQTLLSVAILYLIVVLSIPTSYIPHSNIFGIEINGKFSMLKLQKPLYIHWYSLLSLLSGLHCVFWRDFKRLNNKTWLLGLFSDPVTPFLQSSWTRLTRGSKKNIQSLWFQA